MCKCRILCLRKLWKEFLVREKIRQEKKSMLFKSKKVAAPGCVSAGFYVCVSYGKNF